MPLHLTDNLANLSNAPVARTALQVPASAISGIAGASAITNIVSLSQASYTALVTKDAATLYVISP